MSNCIKRVCLFLFYIAALFIIGCIPEDSLEWSEDGSVGLLCVDGALYLVDGQAGSLTEIAKEDDVQPWPDISKDGSLIVYSRKVDINDLSEGLKLLPDGQARMIEYCGKQMREDIIKAGGLTNDRFPEPSLEILKDDEVQNWVIRYSFENADEKLINVLGEKGIKLGKGKTLSYYNVIAVPRNNLNDKRVIAASIFPIMMTRISPDKKHAAYIMNVQYEGEDMECSLYVASLESDVKNVLINQCVAFGYDWSKDSKKIAYLSANPSDFKKEFILGSLDEIEVADANGALLCNKADIPEQGLVNTYNSTGGDRSLAGIAFYPWMKVRYETGGRIFFSTIKMSLPTNNMNDPGYSIFCYDPVIGAVTDIMPSEASAYAGQAMGMMQFELSPNGKDVLVPIKENRFAGFTLGAKEVDIPFSEDDGFGEDDVSKLLPVFKGNNEISFLVSEDNHFLAEAGQSSETNRYEIIVLNRDTGKSRILSKSWPDEIMNALGN
ncbi:MAG: hypothetical protein JW787_05440 [Sedimentisphaerales bacterium]|nr:hypothetical protein [Sedimentisphaerales bacterium]